MNSTHFKKRLKSSAKWSVISRFGTLGGSLLITGLLSRWLGDQMGDYLIVYSAIILMTTLALSGLPLSVVREMRIAKACHETREPVPVVNNAFAVLLAMCGVLSVVFAIAVWLLGSIVYRGLYVTYLPQILLWFWAASMCWLLGEIFRGYSDFRWATVLEGQFGGLATTGGFLIGSTIYASVAKLDLATTLWLQTAAATASACLGLWRLWQIQPIRFDLRSVGFRKKCWSLFYESVPVAITSLTGTSMWYIELLLAGCWLPSRDIALFGVANQLTRVVSQPLRLVNQSVLPFVTDLHAAGDKTGMEKILRGAATIATLLSLPLLLLMLAIPGTILEICYGSNYADGGWVLQFVAISTFVSVCVGGTGLTLVMTGHQTAQMRLVMLITTVYLLIAPFVFREFGLLGVVGLSSLLTIARSVMTLWLVYLKLEIVTLADLRLGALLSSLKSVRGLVRRRKTSEV